MFKGFVEIDEAYVLGSDTNKHKHKKGVEKQPAIGIVNRNTAQVRAKAVYRNTQDKALIIKDSYFVHTQI